MNMSPIAPALYIVSVAILIIALIDDFFNLNIFNPYASIILYLLITELYKFVAAYTMENDNGTDS